MFPNLYFEDDYLFDLLPACISNFSYMYCPRESTMEFPLIAPLVPRCRNCSAFSLALNPSIASVRQTETGQKFCSKYGCKTIMGNPQNVVQVWYRVNKYHVALSTSTEGILQRIAFANKQVILYY